MVILFYISSLHLQAPTSANDDMQTHTRSDSIYLTFPSLQQMLRGRKWGWNEGLGCSLMQPSWIVSCSSQKVIRLGERRAVCPPAPLGVPSSHLCSDRMYVCGDYKLIVHGGPRGENHITESVGLQATKCRRLYIQIPSSASPHANECVD